MTQELRYQPYARRHIRPERLIIVEEWQFKFYLIEPSSLPQIAHTQIRSIHSVISENLSELEKELHHRVGFVILHRDPEDTWLLINWWAHSSIICQLLFRSDPKPDLIFKKVEQPFVACIWEMVLLGFERDAWVNQALCEGGSVEAYMTRLLPAALY